MRKTEIGRIQTLLVLGDLKNPKNKKRWFQLKNWVPMIHMTPKKEEKGMELSQDPKAVRGRGGEGGRGIEVGGEIGVEAEAGARRRILIY